MSVTVLPEGYRNEWQEKMDALVATNGVDAALGEAYADGMQWTCALLGHPVMHGDGGCVCGNPEATRER